MHLPGTDVALHHLTGKRAASLAADLCRAGAVQLCDYELSAGEAHFARAVALARETGVCLVASFHDFHATPPAEALVARFAAMQAAGADVAKIAVMPQSPRDVLTLLDATLTARETLAVPVISMAMGGYGAVSRLCGWVFGSSVSFAVGEKSSAPGQVPVADVNTVVDVLQRAIAGR